MMEHLFQRLYAIWRTVYGPLYPHYRPNGATYFRLSSMLRNYNLRSAACISECQIASWYQ